MLWSPSRSAATALTHLSAIKALAQVRRLLVPMVQVSVARGCPHRPSGRGAPRCTVRRGRVSLRRDRLAFRRRAWGRPHQDCCAVTSCRSRWPERSSPSSRDRRRASRPATRGRCPRASPQKERARRFRARRPPRGGARSRARASHGSRLLHDVRIRPVRRQNHRHLRPGARHIHEPQHAFSRPFRRTAGIL